MRPHDKKASRKATGVGGVRAILKTKLWWREGFPFEGQWLVVPRSQHRKVEAISLTRSDLSRATYAVKKLIGEFPKALPKVVGNADRWEGNVRGLIESLKPWVHSDTAPVQSHFSEPHYFSKMACKAALALVQESPGLEILVDALSWFLLSEPEAALPYIRWIESEAESLVAILATLPTQESLALCVQFAHLGTTGRQPLGPLLALLNGAVVPLRGATDYRLALEKALLSGKAHRAVKPIRSLSLELRAQCDWLLAADTKTQSRFLRVLEEIDLSPLVQLWSNHWGQLDLVADKVDKLSNSFEKHESKRAKVETLKRKVDRLRSDCPTALPENSLVAALRWFASAGAPLFKTVIDALNTVACVGQSFRPFYLIHWARLAEARLAPNRRILHLLRSFSAYASEPDCDLSPWTKTVIGESRCTVDSEILDPDMRVADIALVFQAFSAYRQGALALSDDNPPGLSLVTDEIIEFIRFTRDPSLSAELGLQLVVNKEFGKYYSDSVVQAALLACESDRSKYVPLLRALVRLEETSGFDVLLLFKTLKAVFAGFPTMLDRLLVANDLRPLRDCGQLLASLSELGASHTFALHDVDERSCLWIALYPNELHRALERLVQVSPDAERIAKRLSKGVLFQERALERERDALISVLETSSGNDSKNQRIRLQNLEKRIANPTEVTPKELEELSMKLEAAAGREWLSDIQLQALPVLRESLSEFFGETQIPEWMTHADTLSLVTSSLRLTGCARKLAVRLFRLRMQPSPWDLRDAPLNRRFVEKMSKQGIEMSPWIDGIEMKRSTEEGVMHLRFADDPLEVFRMGAHFKTCLSPDSFNYFSVFANAADINKRVLYAFSEEGRVVGRQLLCLNDSGQVVAFHSYSHGGQWQFKKHSASFVTRLCAKMKTNTGVSGKIATLVSSDWYDDGAIGLDEHLAFLDQGSPFVQWAANCQPNEFVVELQEKLGEVALEHAIPELYRRGLITDHPNRIIALAGLLNYESLPGEWCVRVAKLIHQAGQSLSPAIVKAVVQYLRTYLGEGWLDSSALDPLVEERPSLVLSILRETRERGVRSWKNETCAARLVIAGKSMLILKRPTQAAALFTLATEVEYDYYGAKQYAREYLASI